MKDPIPTGIPTGIYALMALMDQNNERLGKDRFPLFEGGLVERAAIGFYIREAKNDDSPDTARALAGRMADHIEGKRTLSPEGLQYFAEALRKIADGEDAAKALHTRLGKGKRHRDIDRRNPRIRNAILAMDVQMLMDKGIQQTRNRASSSESACSIIAELNDMDETYIENIYRKYRIETR
jgi:hypothetical protein